MGEACQIESSYGWTTLPVASLSPSVLNTWYALKVRCGGESSVVNALEYRGLSPYCPTQKERRRYSDRIKIVDKPLFPGYVFCAFDIEKKLPIISCPGVDHIVGFAGTAARIPEIQIENIRRMVEAGAVASGRMVPGCRVRVTHGPLSGLEGILVREPRGNRLLVSLDLLNRVAALHVSEDQIITL